MSGTLLVIGGTGMLASATRSLAGMSDHILLVARHASTFAREEGGKYLPLDLDWSDAGFRHALQEALAREEKITRALLWLHQPELILPWLLPLLADTKVVLVLGGVHRNVKPDDLPANVVLVRVGAKPTPDGRRWLTHEEISEGAIDAMKSGRPISIGEIQQRN
jgi:hypothetical protein